MSQQLGIGNWCDEALAGKVEAGAYALRRAQGISSRYRAILYPASLPSVRSDNRVITSSSSVSYLTPSTPGVTYHKRLKDNNDNFICMFTIHILKFQ